MAYRQKFPSILHLLYTTVVRNFNCVLSNEARLENTSSMAHNSISSCIHSVHLHPKFTLRTIVVLTFTHTYVFVKVTELLSRVKQCCTPHITVSSIGYSSLTVYSTPSIVQSMHFKLYIKIEHALDIWLFCW